MARAFLKQIVFGTSVPSSSASAMKLFLELIENEITIDKACKMVGICRTTIYAYAKESLRFKKDMDFAKERNAVSIKKMMFNSAKGGRATEKIVKNSYDKEGNLLFSDETIKHIYIKPNVSAQEFLLINKANWSRDSDKGVNDRKSSILEELDKLVEISDEQMEVFDNENV